MTGTRSGRVYLFIARRDKSAVKILAILSGNPKSGRVTDVTKLGLPDDIRAQVEKYCYDNRMYWEPWIEPAATFQELSTKLVSRGYRGLPPGGQPLVTYLPGQQVNTATVDHRETMLRPKRR